jgi:hypothetical protein
MFNDKRVFLKNEILPNIDQYLSKAEYVGWEANKKTNKKPDIKCYHYFKTTLPDNKPAYLAVEENNAGKFILYSITDDLRQTVSFIQSSS